MFAPEEADRIIQMFSPIRVGTVKIFKVSVIIMDMWIISACFLSRGLVAAQPALALPGIVRRMSGLAPKAFTSTRKCGGCGSRTRGTGTTKQTLKIHLNHGDDYLLQGPDSNYM
jgi:hypothetical protein